MRPPLRFTSTRWLFLQAAFCAIVAAGYGRNATAADTRAAFLQLIDHPRVPLSPTVSPPEEKDGLVEIAFSFAADPAQRVPGLLVKTTNSTGRRPVVISLHGTGSTKEGQRALLADLAHEGFIGVAIDGRYHGARTRSGKGTAEYNEAILRAYRDAPNSEHPFYFDTAWDVMRLIDFLQTRDDVDATRIGLIGFSKGGIETYLAAAVDPRIAVAVPCIGVQSFRWALDHDSWRSRIETIQTAFDAAAAEAHQTHPDAAFVHAFYQRVAPGIDGEFDGPAMLPLIAPRPLLSINGEIDPRTPTAGLNECAEAARAAYRSAGAEDKFELLIEPHTGHKVTPEAMKAAHAWFVRWLKP